jgi:hypothetical protein
VRVMCVGEIEKSVESLELVLGREKMHGVDSPPERPKIIQNTVTLLWGAEDPLDLRGGRGSHERAPSRGFGISDGGRNDDQDLPEDVDHECGHLKRILNQAREVEDELGERT